MDSSFRDSVRDDSERRLALVEYPAALLLGPSLKMKRNVSEIKRTSQIKKYIYILTKSVLVSTHDFLTKFKKKDINN